MKNDKTFEEDLTCCFKMYMRNLTNIDQNTQESQQFAVKWAPSYTYSQELLFLSYKKISKRAVKLGSFLQCLRHIFLRHDSCF